MNGRFLWIPVLLLAATSCCEPLPPRTIVISCQDGDAGAAEPFEADQSSEALGLSSPCARACKNLSILGCPESVRLPAGKTCVETCKDIAAMSSFNPACVERAKSVDEVRKCPQLSCKK